MKLTRRQEEFIETLLDLHKELDGPIHYTMLAERLGVSPFTAYDMLCVLEDKGFVTSEYHLATDKSGPGRAERVFYPTESGREREQRLAQQAGIAHLEGEQLKEYIIEKLRKGDVWDKDLAEEMLARVPPEGHGQVRYCVEVMSIVSLRLRNTEGKDIFKSYFQDIVPISTDACRANLTLLGGFAFGLLAQECSADQEWVQNLFEHVQHYQEIVTNMKIEKCRQLADFLVTVFKPLTE